MAALANNKRMEEFEQLINKEYQVSRVEKDPMMRLYKVIGVADSIIADYFFNKSARFTPADDFYKKLELAYKLAVFPASSKDQDYKLIPGRVLNLVYQYFSNYTYGTRTKTQYVMLSAHDSTMTPVLQALGQLNQSCYLEALNKGNYNYEEECGRFPVFASNLIFELVREKSTLRFGIRARYNRQYLKVCGREVSTVDQFYNCIQSVTDGWWDVCGNGLSTLDI